MTARLFSLRSNPAPRDPALVRRAKALGFHAEDAAEVCRAARVRAGVARRVVDSAATELAAQVAILVNALDPSLVVLGGGVGAAPGRYWSSFRAALPRFTWGRHARRVRVRRARLGARGGVIGAALSAIEASSSSVTSSLVCAGGSAALWESTIKGNLMNTRTTMKAVARSDWRLATAISAILLSSALPHGAAAQSANAALRGKAPGGSEVTATNTDTGLTRRTQVNADGSYVLVGLPPGTYRVSAGPGTEQVVSLSVASTATLDLGGEQAPTALGEVTVSGNRLAEVRTSEVGGGISLRQIEVTPQITRNFLEFADAVPGMQFSVDAKGRHTDPQRTLNTGTTNVYIDGVGQKNYVRPSGVTGRRAPIRARTLPAVRATRSRSSPSPNTRSSPRTTRRSTTRSPAPRSRPSPSRERTSSRPAPS